MAAVRLSFTRFGSPAAVSRLPPIVILHGLFGCGNNWRTLANKMATQTNRMVYAVDARNHGNSEHVAHMSYELMSRDMVEFCREHQLKGTTLIGHSMGGKTAMVMAMEHPELVERLVVLDVSPTTAPGRGEVEDLVSTLKKLEVSKIGSRREADELLNDEIPDCQLRNFLLTNLVNSDDNNGSGRLRWKVNLDAIEDNIQRIKSFPHFDRSRTFKGPSLFLGGGNSNYIGHRQLPEIMRLFPRAHVSHIPDAGHWLHFERPVEFLKVVSRFINRT